MGALGAIVPPSRENLPFLKEYKNEIIHLVLPHLKFWPAIEKCYYLSISASCQVIHNESFKDQSGCSSMVSLCSSSEAVTGGIIKKLCSKKFRKIHRKTPVNRRPEICNFIKRRLQYRCFPVGFAKFLKTHFLQDTCR